MVDLGKSRSATRPAWRNSLRGSLVALRPRLSPSLSLSLTSDEGGLLALAEPIFTGLHTSQHAQHNWASDSRH